MGEGNVYCTTKQVETYLTFNINVKRVNSEDSFYIDAAGTTNDSDICDGFARLRFYNGVFVTPISITVEDGWGVISTD